ncbi:hypothetical protein CJ030_MR6G018870 [Morella rubra]|uniref:Uncharacterized protein n=1 Tax=Morella rubra TaxID=262757 RepID=A0A6A1VCE5_9ROSI|nr:hypothetical protein CJ030_MR6G018873 [Morella rubra]KAB1209541.1 hypothetical protein CJ030_MR6G018870 [Morella rubra]
MAAGGKCLRCDSSARFVGASDQTGTKAAATLANATVTTSNGANKNLPSPALVFEAPRRVVVRDAWIALEKARIAGKLSVHIPNGRMSGDDKASSMLSSHTGSLVRSHAQFDVVSWSKVPDEVKSYHEQSIDDFNLDYDRPKDRNNVMSTMNTAYMTHRNRMHQYYALFPTKEEALEHPYSNMKKEE